MIKKESISKRTGSQFLIIGFLFIIFSIAILAIYVTFYAKKQELEKDMLNTFYEEQQIVDRTDIGLETSAGVKEESKSNIQNTKYVATIKIPKIKLERGLYSKNSYFNNVNRNIMILKESNYPDSEKGNFILAAHSGNSSVSYFRYLYKLSVDDEIFITYNHHIYKYKIVNIYDIPKTGKANIVRNHEKTTLTLITCRSGTKKQIIIISELNEVKEV